jgi:hypothetical protein
MGRGNQDQVIPIASLERWLFSSPYHDSVLIKSYDLTHAAAMVVFFNLLRAC